MTQPKQTYRKSFLRSSIAILRQTAQEWLEDKAPQLGAALAYYTVFSLAPLILVLLAIVAFIVPNEFGAETRTFERGSASPVNRRPLLLAKIVRAAHSTRQGVYLR